MGFYIRKSLSVGPLRFNLSKSGIGVSAGITGFRLGMGPSGNYVHMGRGGLYYRKSLGSKPRSGQPGELNEKEMRQASIADLETIESAHVSEMTDSTSAELLSELQEKRAKWRLWPFVMLAASSVVIYGLISDWPSWVIALTVILGVAGAVVASMRDELQKTVVLFYEMDGDTEAAYEELHSAARQLMDCSTVWHVGASGRAQDRKYTGGAGTIVQRTKTRIGVAQPPYVKANVEVIAVGVGKQTLYLFPDRILVFDASGVGAVGYQQLKIGVTAVNFVESDPVPADAKIVGKTWQYVNRSGGPDRRFKDNREIPLCLYDEMTLRSPSGLNEMLQISRCGVATSFLSAVEKLKKSLPR